MISQKLLTGAAPIALGIALLSAPASAQIAPTSTPATTPGVTDTASDTIVVTGSLIRNPNLTASSPVSVVSEKEISLRTPNNVEELLRTLPGITPGIGTQVNNGATGEATVDLRGLGTQRNIVLLDGNRIVPTLANGAVDLNNIPVALLQRVDVLTGGASTTYGADAVTGVVNFITKRDFTGVDLQGSYKLPGRGDGHSYRMDLTVGANFADGKGNAVISMGYTSVDPLYQTRPFALYGVSSTTGRASGSSFTSTPTTISFPNGDNLQVAPGGGSFVPFYQGFNFNPYNIFQTPLARKSAYAAAHYEVADNVEVYARAIASQNSVKTIIAPSGVFGLNLTVPANNPYLSATQLAQLCAEDGLVGAACTNNAAIPLPSVYRRVVELGPRLETFENTMYDARAGVRWDISTHVNLDVNASYGRSEQTDTRSGYVLNTNVQQALNATNTTTCTVTTGNCVPLNLFGPAGSITNAMLGFLQGQSTTRVNTQLRQGRALLSGDTGFQSPWASKGVNFAVGGEYRAYDYDRIPDAFAQSPSQLGGAGGAVLPFTGGYNVKEAFGELIAPIVADRPFIHELSAEAGVRYSSYSVDAPSHPSFNATTYKAGLTWVPDETIRFRGNYQRAVRAPNIGELFAPTVTGLTNLAVDPCAGAAPTTNANLRAVCIAQGASAASIGNIQNPSAGQANATFVTSTTLKPEKADTFTVGFVLTPRRWVPGLNLSVDYYNIRVRNAITFLVPGDAIAACFNNLTAASATNPACTSIQRNPGNGRLSGNASNTPGLLLPESNNGRLKTDGVDVTANYGTRFDKVGLNLNFVGNYTHSQKFQAGVTSVDRDCVGYYSSNCGPSNGQIQPKFSFQQRTTVGYGPASISLLWRYINPVRYEGLADNYIARGFTDASRFLYNGVITNSGVNSALAGSTHDFNKIPAYHYFDLSAQWDITDRYTLTLGVQNLFDRDPPIVGGQAGTTAANGGNTFPSTYDVLGRTYSVSVHVRL